MVNARWQQRDVAFSCAQSTLPIKVGQTGFAVPSEMLLSVRASDGPLHYLHNDNKGLRELCAASRNGVAPVSAKILTFEMARQKPDRETTCKASAPEWAATYCAATKGVSTHEQRMKTDFPNNLSIQEVAERSSTTGFCTYDRAQRVPADQTDPIFIQTDATTPDQRPLTYQC